MVNDNSIIRQARNAVDLVINGAIRQIEGNYASPTDPEDKAIFDAEMKATIDLLVANVVEEAESWLLDDVQTEEGQPEAERANGAAKEIVFAVRGPDRDGGWNYVVFRGGARYTSLVPFSSRGEAVIEAGRVTDGDFERGCPNRMRIEA